VARATKHQTIISATSSRPAGQGRRSLTANNVSRNEYVCSGQASGDCGH